MDARDAAALLELVHDGARDAGHGPFPPSVLYGFSRLISSDACVSYREADIDYRAQMPAQSRGVRTRTAAAAYASSRFALDHGLRARGREEDGEAALFA